MYTCTAYWKLAAVDSGQEVRQNTTGCKVELDLEC